MDVLTYKCPNCGGELLFDPETQKFKCEYCLSYFDQKEVESPDLSTEKQSSTEHVEEALVYHCPSCGAEIVTDSTTAATFCFYCHNPVILSGRLDGSMKPDLVIPFVLDREEAVRRFSDWIRKKWFVPKAFFSKDQIEKVSGIYFPYWLYECHAKGSLEAIGNTVRTWRSGNYRYTEHSFFKVRRAGDLYFHNLMKKALRKTDAALCEGILPFEIEKTVPFSMTFLSGFHADKRDIEIQELSDEIAGEIQQYARQMLQESAQGYASLSGENYDIKIVCDRVQYVLVPVWILTYPKNGKTYYYAMNGQTGKVCGVLPINWKKLLLCAALLVVGVFSILMLGGYFL